MITQVGRFMSPGLLQPTKAQNLKDHHTLREPMKKADLRIELQSMYL